MTQFLDTPVDKSLTATAAWTDIDLSANVPTSATGAIFQVINTSASGRAYGFRKNGSTDNRHLYVHNGRQLFAIIGLDANRKCEGYIQTTEVNFHLVGYTEGDAAFFTNAYDKSLTATSAWTDIDLSSELPAGSIAAIFEVDNNSTTTGYPFGLRKKGSTDNRTSNIDIYNHHFFVVGVDGNRICQGYIGNVVVDFHLVGYLSEGQAKTNAVDKSLGSTGSYIDIGIDGSENAPSGVTGVFGELISSGVYSYAVRKNGSGFDKYYDTSIHNGFFCGLETNEKWEGKIENLGVDFYAMGYFINCDPYLIDNMDSATNWVAVGSGQTPTLNTTTKHEGTGSLNLLKGTGGAAAGWYRQFTAIDLTNAKVKFWLYIEDVAARNKLTHALFTLYTSDGNWARWDFPVAGLSIGWNLLVVDTTTEPDTKAGTPNFASITRTYIYLNTNNVDDTYVAGDMLADHIHFSDQGVKESSIGLRVITKKTKESSIGLRVVSQKTKESSIGLSVIAQETKQSSIGLAIQGAFTKESSIGLWIKKLVWLTGYDYRKKGAVVATTAGAQTKYQLKLKVGESSGAVGEDVDCNSHCEDFPNDIRFTKEDGKTKHDYWVDTSSLTGTTPNQKVDVWIEVVTIPASGSVDFYMYYGKIGDSGESNGTNTFLGGTDFAQDDGFSFRDAGADENYGNVAGELRNGGFEKGEFWDIVKDLGDTRIDALCDLGSGTCVLGTRDANSGHIWKSTDYGLTWSDLGQKTTAGILNILKITSSIVLFSTDTGHIWKSSDSGSTWADKGDVTGSGERVYSMCKTADGSILASEYPTPNGASHVYKSVNNGDTWTDKGQVSTGRLYRFEVVGDGVLLNSVDGKVYKSTDNGNNWDAGTALSSYELYATEYLGNGICLQGDNNGHIFKSSNNGGSWLDKGKIGTSTDDLVDFGDGVVVLSDFLGSEYMYRSTDYGDTWAQIGKIGIDAWCDHMILLDNGVAIGGTGEYTSPIKGYVVRSEGTSDLLNGDVIDRISDSYAKKTITSINDNFSMIAKVKPVKTSQASDAYQFPVFGISATGERIYNSANAYSLDLLIAGNSKFQLCEYTGQDATYYYLTDPIIISLLKTYTVDLRKVGSTAYIYVYEDGVLVDSKTLAMHDSTKNYTYLMPYQAGRSAWSSQTSTWDLVYLFLHKYLSPEPTWGSWESEQTEKTKTSSIGVAIQETFTKESSIGVAIQETFTKESSIGLRVISKKTKQSSIGLTVLETITKESSIGMSVGGENEVVSIIGIRVVNSETKESTLGMTIAGEGTKESSISLTVLETFTKESSIGISVQETFTKESSISLRVVNPKTKESSISLAIWDTLIKESSIGMYVLVYQVKDSTIGMCIKGVNTKDSSIGMTVIEPTLTKGFYYAKLGNIALEGVEEDNFRISKEINQIPSFDYEIANCAVNRTTITDNITEEFKIYWRHHGTDTHIFTGIINADGIEYISLDSIEITGYASYVVLSWPLLKHLAAEDAELVNKVFSFDGTYTDCTTQANNAAINDVPVSFADENHGLYIGENQPFWGAQIKYSTKGVVADCIIRRRTGAGCQQIRFFPECQDTSWTRMVIEYSKGGGIWETLDALDESDAFTEDPGTYNLIIAHPPGDWARNTVDGVSRYWIRWRLAAGICTTPPKLDRIYIVNVDVYRTYYFDTSARAILLDALEGTDYTMDATDSCPEDIISVVAEYESPLRVIAAIPNALTWTDDESSKKSYQWWIDDNKKVHIKQQRGTVQPDDITGDMTIFNNHEDYFHLSNRLIGLGPRDGLGQMRAIVEDKTSIATHTLREIAVAKEQILKYDMLKTSLEKDIAISKNPMQRIRGNVTTEFWGLRGYEVGDTVTLHQGKWNVAEKAFQIVKVEIGPNTTTIDLGISQDHLNGLRDSLQRQLTLNDVKMHGSTTLLEAGPITSNYQRVDAATVYPAKLEIEIPSTVKKVHKVLLSWTLGPYRAAVNPYTGTIPAHDHDGTAGIGGAVESFNAGAGGAFTPDVEAGGAFTPQMIGGEHMHLVKTDIVLVYNTADVGILGDPAQYPDAGKVYGGNHRHSKGATGGPNDRSLALIPEGVTWHWCDACDFNLYNEIQEAYFATDTHIHHNSNTFTGYTSPNMGVNISQGTLITSIDTYAFSKMSHPEGPEGAPTVHLHDGVDELAHGHQGVAEPPHGDHVIPLLVGHSDHNIIPDTGGTVAVGYGIHEVAGGTDMELLVNGESVGIYTTAPQTEIRIDGWLNSGNNTVELQPKVGENNKKGGATLKATGLLFIEPVKF